jgi:hypothetical protein
MKIDILPFFYSRNTLVMLFFNKILMALWYFSMPKIITVCLN